MRRRLIILGITLLTLLLLAFVTVQVIFLTDIPRRMVINALQEQTGLHISAASLRTGWFGRTTVQDMRVTLPLESQPFLTIPRLTVTHAAFIPMAIFQDSSIDSMKLTEPYLQLHQDDTGRWNVLNAVRIIQQLQTASGQHQGNAPPVPKVEINNLQVTVSTPENSEQTYKPITFNLVPTDALSATFTLRLDEQQIAEGQLAAHGAWTHQVSFHLPNLDQWLTPWLENPVPAVSTTGTWEGRIAQGTLSGELRLDSMRIGDVSSAGQMQIKVDGSQITLMPRQMTVSTVDAKAPMLHLSGGMMRLNTDSEQVHLQRVMLTALQTQVQVDGNWNGPQRTAQLDASWIGQLDGPETSQQGSITAELVLPTIGEAILTADIQSQGILPDGHWSSQWQGTARSSDWKAMTAHLQAQRLTITSGDDSVDLSGLEADLSMHRSLRQVTINRLATDPKDLHGVIFSASGAYTPGEPQPLRLQTHFDATLASDKIHAQLGAAVSVAGCLQPLELKVEGELQASDVRWHNHPIAPLQIPVRGEIHSDRLMLDMQDFDLLGGRWQLSSRYDRPSDQAVIAIRADQASIANISQLLDLPLPLAGSLAMDAELTMPELDPSLAHLEGDWQVADLKSDRLAIVSGQGRIEYADQLLRFQDVSLSDGEGSLTGWAIYDLHHSDSLQFEVQTRRWRAPIQAGDLKVRMDASAAITMNLTEKTGEGRATIDADVIRDEEPVAQLQLAAGINGQSVVLERFTASGLGGQLQGDGHLVFTESGWNQSRIDLSWSDLNLSQVSPFVPDTDELSGTCSGTLRLGQSEDVHALEPMRIDLNVKLTEGRYGPLSLGDMQMVAYMGAQRLVIEQAHLNAIGGRIELWGRLTEHADQLFTHVRVGMDSLDLQQIAQWLGHTEGPTLGRLSGSGNAGGYLVAPHRLFGQANLQLVESDIASMPGIAQIYNTLRIDFGRVQATGRGDMSVRLEGESLEISRLSYFNRGTNIIARLNMQDISRGMDSPINGVMVGVVRPLGGAALPLFGEDLDRLFSALQSGVASARISGTLAEPVTTVVPLEEVTGAVGRILTGKVQ